MAREIQIPLKKLALDKYNVRGGEWVSDEELINSIKKQGVIEPLIVRPAPKKTKAEYTIVCGSRRYFASQEALLKEAPCIVKKLTDDEALGLSITENKDRKDIPVWRYIEKIGERFNEINGRMSRQEKINHAQEHFKLSRQTATRYIDILGSPQIFELMKPEDERSPEVKKLLKKLAPGGEDTTKQLQIHIAEKIARKLQDFPIKKQVEVGVVLLGKTEKAADELLSQVLTFPNVSANELFEEKVLKIPKGFKFSISFGAHLREGLEKAMIREGLDRTAFINKILENYLKRRGYI